MGSIAIAGSSGRTILTATREFYVSATGSDSGPGTLASPWATLQHAMDTIAHTIDTAGNLARINIGAGTFVGVGLKGFVGNGAVEFKGAGPSSTTIDNGPNDGVFNHGEPFSVYPSNWCSFYINELKIKPSTNINNACAIFVNTGPTEIIIGQDQDNAIAGHITMDSGAAPSLFFVTLNGPNTFFLDSTLSVSNVTLNGNAAGYLSPDIDTFAFIAGSYTISGTPTYSTAFVNVADSSSLVDFGATFSGAATGVRFIVDGSSVIDANDSTGTKYPGGSVGTLAPGATYTGITSYSGHVAGLPAAIKNATAFTDDSLNPVFSSIAAGGGAVYTAVYADGTNWRWG